MTVKQCCFRLYLTEHILGLTRDTIIRGMLQRKHPEELSRLHYITGKLDGVVRSVQCFVDVPDSEQSNKKKVW